MTLNRESFLHAAYPPPLQRPVEGPRCFVLRWNSRKAKGTRVRADEWQECQGVLFDAHDAQVRVVLSNGQMFPTLAEMEHVLSLGGDFEVNYLN